jgi:hypothetical protein
MDTAAVAKDGRTYVPIRFVAEALGAYVGYSDLYKCVEIVMPDELTADEIKRLRSYDMIQYLDLSQWDATANSWWLDREEYDYFSGNYWFSNSHNFLVSWPYELGFNARDVNRKINAEATTNAKDYVKFAVDFIDNQIEMEEDVVTENLTIPGLWAGKIEGYRDLTINFRTDTSMVYQMICMPEAMISIRGVMDVTINEGTDKDWFAKWYGIENAEDGKTYSIDCEFIIATNSNGYLYDLADYRFDSNGNAIPFHVGAKA